MEQAESTLGAESKKTQKKHGEEQLKEQSCWTRLPDDILKCIMNRLCPTDYRALLQVCSSWRIVVANATANRHCHPLPQFPILLLWGKNEDEELRQGISFHGCIEGWFILSTYVAETSIAISFLNPMTNTRIPVRSILNFPTNSPMGKMVASSDPRHLDCILVGLFTDGRHIAFCRLSNMSWIIIESVGGELHSHTYPFRDIEIFGTTLYARIGVLFDYLLVYDLNDSSRVGDGPPVFRRYTELPELRGVHRRRGVNRFFWDGVYRFLVRDDASRELLLIDIYSNAAYQTVRIGKYNLIIPDYIFPPRPYRCEVFKLNISKWEKIDSLGDRVVFLSNRSSMVLTSTALGDKYNYRNRIHFSLFYPCPLIKERGLGFFKRNPRPPRGLWRGTQRGTFRFTDAMFRCYSDDVHHLDPVPNPFT